MHLHQPAVGMQAFSCMCVCVYVCVWVCVGVYLVNRWHPGTFWRNIGAVVAAGAGRPGI